MQSRLARSTTPATLALELVRRGHRGVALLDPRREGGWGAGWVTCEPDAEHEGALPPVQDASCEPGDPLEDAPRWVGVVPYEACRALERPRWSAPDTRPEALLGRPRWQRYAAAARFDQQGVEVVGVGPVARALVEALQNVGEQNVVGQTSARGGFRARNADPLEAHAERVRRAIELIRAGDLYQVNLARLISVEAESVDLAAALGAYARMAERAAPPFGAFLDLGAALVLSTSPELLLDARPEGAVFRLTTEPIKGTRPRGATPEEDATLAAELEADPKERAELAMIVDVERNDLGRVARTGSVAIVDAPQVVTFATVHHRVARLEALSRDGLGLSEVVASMVPSGSVTGAPKVRAMEVIASLEAHRRGLYTGALGALSWGGRLTLAMAIRTLVLEPGLQAGEWHTGGGIVLGSDPWREVEETRWKASQLEALL